MTLALNGIVDDDASVGIELKDPAGAYWAVGTLGSYNTVTVISGPATYRFTRVAGASCGVFNA